MSGGAIVLAAALFGTGVLATPGTSLLTSDTAMGAAMLLAAGAAVALRRIIRSPRVREVDAT